MTEKISSVCSFEIADEKYRIFHVTLRNYLGEVHKIGVVVPISKFPTDREARLMLMSYFSNTDLPDKIKRSWSDGSPYLRTDRGFILGIES